MSCSDLIVPVTWLIREMTYCKPEKVVTEVTGIVFAICSKVEILLNKLLLLHHSLFGIKLIV